jgi:hypothetical protein
LEFLALLRAQRVEEEKGPAFAHKSRLKMTGMARGRFYQRPIGLR